MDQARTSSLGSAEDSPGILEDEEQHAAADQRLYPSDELVLFQQELVKLRASNHGLQGLVHCLREAWHIVCNTHRQTDMDAVRRFFRDDLQLAMDKLLCSHGPRAPQVEYILFESLLLVVMIATEMLKYRKHQSAAVLSELDADLSPLMLVVLGVLGTHRPLHDSRELELVPDQLVDRYEPHAYDNDVEWVVERTRSPTPHQEQQEDDMQEDGALDDEPIPINLWFTHLANTFGRMDGFNLIIQMVTQPACVSFNLLNICMAVLAQVVTDATDEAKEQFKQVIGPVSAHVLELVVTGSDRLADHGNDRTFNIFHALVNINLQRLITYACNSDEMLPWRRQLRAIMHAFVTKMLESSTFNKLLSGARECHKMLRIASNNWKEPYQREVLQEHIAWMRDNDIVQRLLRTGLHHKQYMNEVKGIMVILTQRACLTAEHLDLMWAVTEKEDAYDAVKTHMFDLLAAVAAECQPAQLDMLFAKLERRQARSVQDTERLLALLESLAESDTDGKMEGNIIDLVWELTIPADAPTQLLDLRTMSSVVRLYCGECKQPLQANACYSIIRRCFEAFKSGEGGIVPLLRTARDLLSLLQLGPKSKTVLMRDRAVDDLINKHGVVQHLVDTVCARVSAVRDKIAATAATAAAGDGDAGGPDGGPDATAAAIRAAAVAELDDGAWSYADVIKEMMLSLRMLANWSTSYFPDGLAERLWDTLMVDAPCGEDQLQTTQVFFKAGFVEINSNFSVYFDDRTQRQLMETHLVKQNPETMHVTSAKLTWEIFGQVNSHGENAGLVNRATAKPPEYTAWDLQLIIGLPLIWDMYLSNKDDNVSDFLRNRLLVLYHLRWRDDDTPAFHKALVGELVARLHGVQDTLSAPNSTQAQLAARIVARALALANAAVDGSELPTMPPEPAHSRSWRGTPVQLEVLREGSGRLRITTHENEYIGLLRQRLALAMGCSAKSVRMVVLGHELVQDSATVSNAGLRNRASVTTQDSPIPNKFTQAPSEYRDSYETTSIVFLLSHADGLYPLLLKFIDTASDSQDIVSLALQLLAVLPTYGILSEELAAALDGPDKAKRLANALCAGSSLSNGGGQHQQHQQQPVMSPYKTLYTLQALCELLFPTFDEALVAAMEREARAEGSACPSPAAAAPGAGAAAAAPAAAGAGGPAPMVPADDEAARHQHHREVQQQEFLHCGGLESFVQVAQMAAQCNPADLRLQRQLSELLVTLHHNLLSAAQSWQAPPPAAAAPGHSNGPSAMSGAESGAGHPGGAPRHAAPASSLVGPSQGGGGAAVAAAAGRESTSMAMADVQAAGAAADTSAAAGDSPGGNAAATTSDTAYHHPPSSPAMEVSSPLPGQQQQQGTKQQRQRGGDLPPLPPLHAALQQQQQVAGGQPQAAASAAAGPSLAALFSAANLRLMAESLLGIAVSTSQLWGSSDPAAALSDDDGNKDVTVAREALLLLQRLLEAHPPLVQWLLLDVEQTPLISSVLLSPFYTVLRRQAAELLERLVCVDSYRQRLLPWLLERLAAARPLAQQHPASCAEFYHLLSSMLAKLGNSWGLLPEQLFATASAMLDEEVAALQAIAAAGPVRGLASSSAAKSQQQQQQQQQQQHQMQLRRSTRRRRQQAAAADDGEDGDDGDEQGQPPSCLLLQGRLQLVLALVRVLDRRAVGSEGQGSLMKLLLQEFLFPEAVAKVAAASGQLSLQRCAASLEPHCATPSSRRAALELLAELMGDTPASLEEGVNMLFSLHYQQQVLPKTGMQPRTLRGPGQYAGLKNGGATCYMNSVFQQLFMQPDIRAHILASAEVPDAEKPDSVFAQLQGLFAHLALSKSTFAAPFRFWAAFKDYDGTPIDVREHQDAYEFFTRLQDFVDQHLISTNQQPAIKPVMGGTFVQQIICRGHDFTSERTEDFYQISVEVKGMGTLQRSLDDYVKGELMEGDNAYMCEELGKRVPAVKRTAIKSLPQMLCVHLKRFEFDYLNQTRHKLRDRFEFPFELDMFPYTAEGLEAADQQQKAAEEQQQQQQEEEGQQQPGPQPRQMRSSSSSGAGLGAAASGAGAANPAYMYDLHGVVVHSGSAFTGHYYSYIKERAGSSSSSGGGGATNTSSSPNEQQQQGPRWYCFDDKDVALWDEGQLETDCFGGKFSQDFANRQFRPPRNEYERAHSAYMLFYERRATTAGGQPCSSAGAAVLAPQQQQQEEEEAAAQGDADVDMANGDAAPPAAQDAAAAAAADGAGGGPAADQQQLQLARTGSVSIPYSLPFSLFREITEANINLMWQLHVLDKHYFRFVRQLVDSRGDLGQLTTRKARRREGGGGGAGSGGLAHSSMACDPMPMQTPPQQQQQHQQPCPSTGSGALPMQVSPSPTPAASAPAPVGDTAAGVTPAQSAAAAVAATTQSAPVTAGGPSPLEVPGSSSLPADLMLQSPGPSSRRGEEAEAVAQALMRLGVLFQFQVYLYAHESLRGEANVWTEALRSLMGSGSSSTACMQVFLELVQTHPQWLSRFLLDASTLSQSCPRLWASDMLSWTLQAASKRCAHQLQAYVCACLQLRVVLAPGPGDAAAAGGGGAGGGGPQAQEQALRTSLLPPLGQALLGVVEQLVVIIRGTVPRVNQGGHPIGVHDIPSEPARVLLAYAESSPWAAAHLLQTFNIVPDLADHINAALVESGGGDELTCEELIPLLELLGEVLSYASNLPELTYEANMSKDPHKHNNPYVRALPGSGGGADGSGSSSSGEGGGGGARGGNGDAAAAGLRAVLSESCYCKLTRGWLCKGLTHPTVLQDCKRALHLAALLCYSSFDTMVTWVPHAASAIYGTLSCVLHDSISDAHWEELCLKLALIALQPDQWVDCRVSLLLNGVWGANAAEGPGPKSPGLLAYPQPVCWHSLASMKVLGALIRHCADPAQQHTQLRRAHKLLVAIGKVLHPQQQHVMQDLTSLVVTINSRGDIGVPASLLQEVGQNVAHAIQVYLQDSQARTRAAQQWQQQQQQGMQQQQQAVAGPQQQQQQAEEDADVQDLEVAEDDEDEDVEVVEGSVSE